MLSSSVFLFSLHNVSHSHPLQLVRKTVDFETPWKKVIKTDDQEKTLAMNKTPDWIELNVY